MAVNRIDTGVDMSLQVMMRKNGLIFKRDYPLLLDGGARSGADVAKALILGANFVLMGRPFLYAAAALGPIVGVARFIEMPKSERDNAMAQLACAKITDLTGDRLWRG